MRSISRVLCVNAALVVSPIQQQRLETRPNPSGRFRLPGLSVDTCWKSSEQGLIPRGQPLSCLVQNGESAVNEIKYRNVIII